MKVRIIKRMSVALCLVLSIASFQVNAETKNRVGYDVSGEILSGDKVSHKLELFTTHEDGELLEFYAQVKTSFTSTGFRGEYIKYFPIKRYKQVTRKLRKVNRPWVDHVVDQPICDSIPRVVRFKKREQLISDTCGSISSDDNVISPEMQTVEKLLRKLMDETLSSPDMAQAVL